MKSQGCGEAGATKSYQLRFIARQQMKLELELRDLEHFIQEILIVRHSK